MVLKLLASVAIASLLYAQPTCAGRPFTTEDAGVIAPAACELESYAAYLRPRLDPAERGGWAQVGCGIGANTQLAVGGGRFKSDEYHTVAALSGKTALRRLTDTDTGVALAYALGAIKPPGHNMRHERSSVSLVLTVPRGRTLVHANLGMSRSQFDRKTAATYAFAIERLGAGGLDVGIEAFGQDSESLWLGAGARYAVKPEKLLVDFSFAVQSNSARTRQLTMGFRYAF